MQRRVGDILDLDVVKIASHHVRLELQLSKPKGGHRPEVTLFEVQPCLRRIDRRHVQQQIHASLNLGQAGIDLQSRRKELGRGCHLAGGFPCPWSRRSP